jgi:hypothetical protein
MGVADVATLGSSASEATRCWAALSALASSPAASAALSRSASELSTTLATVGLCPDSTLRPPAAIRNGHHVGHLRSCLLQTDGHLAEGAENEVHLVKCAALGSRVTWFSSRIALLAVWAAANDEGLLSWTVVPL